MCLFLNLSFGLLFCPWLLTFGFTRLTYVLTQTTYLCADFTACAPKLTTCNWQQVSTLFVSLTKGRGWGATHHPACVTLRRCPPPYLPLANRDDKLRNTQKMSLDTSSGQKNDICALYHSNLITSRFGCR